MQRITMRRIFLTLFSIVTLSAAGVLTGYLIGREITLKSIQSKLVVYASGTLAQGEASIKESMLVLAEMNASPYISCSAEELNYLRQLLFRSEYLKEMGRIQDAKIVCSATLGKLLQPMLLPQPEFSSTGKTKSYVNLPVFQIQGLDVVSVQRGESYVVLNPHILQPMEPFPSHLTITVRRPQKQQPGQLLGNRPQINSELLLKDGQAKTGEVLYATRCSSQFGYCMSAFITTREALLANRRGIIGYAALGGIAGSAFGFVFALLLYRKKSLEHRLQRAIAKDKLRVVYQPIVDLSTRQTVGAEALLRWTDEEGCAHNPELLVKLAEECGFICSLTELVLRHIIQDFGTALRENSEFKLNLNITASDLNDPHFIPMVERLLIESDILPGSIGLELTENSTTDRSIAMDAILKLRTFGHSIFIDDFGTGYSSLSYLHELSVDAMKIDRSFTNAIETQAVIVSILPQILEMAKTLKLNVVIEGIETESQADYFKGISPRVFAQGWLFGRPVSAEEFHTIYIQQPKETHSMSN